MCILLFPVALLALLFLIRLWHHPTNKHLPPGSMGWPYVGETFKLYSQSPESFFADKQRRYGAIFKTHILGCPCIMISNPEAARCVLVSQAHRFKPTFPSSKERMIGPQALFFHQGEYHTRLRKLVQASLLPNAIRDSVSDIEKVVLSLLKSWECTTVNTFHEMKKLTFEVAMLAVFGSCRDLDSEGIKSLYLSIERGYNSMPLNFPGTSFHKAMKARKRLSEMLRKVMAKRRAEKVTRGGLLEILMASSKGGKRMELTDGQIADNVIGVIFAAQDTTASALTWREQEGIRREMIKGNRRLTWNDTRNMPLTTRVIQETLRAASILSFTFREAVEDVELNGYVIPKGWKVLPLFRNIHHCAEFFPEPEKFDPSRFEVPLKPNTFMPFGNGLHSCPGSELAKLEMLVLLHHFTTKYRWDVVGKESGVQYGPFPVPKQGLPIRVSNLRNRKSTTTITTTTTITLNKK
ncbi:abscisic acid 8'-hydroxylase 2 isoform X2 [Amborella trichopoda]|uniref:abscisic acid 8'-hydroxylase 2 isoform X2 n=1 Tax=Amborella trichopoda TaxID=13333 RepID=UPI0009C033A6|nr:abscisic acid 8'-hydroxylase 2 isoform X2 [Amborella trichopoda]|eukprot:XP_020523949.1 abscisic acid 8'-hydroxylase 2 isoform X2 [Amborella trichopoda]